MDNHIPLLTMNATDVKLIICCAPWQWDTRMKADTNLQKKMGNDLNILNCLQILKYLSWMRILVRHTNSMRMLITIQLKCKAGLGIERLSVKWQTLYFDAILIHHNAYPLEDLKYLSHM